MNIQNLLDELKTTFAAACVGLIEKGAIEVAAELDHDGFISITFRHQQFVWGAKRGIWRLSELERRDQLSREINSILAEAIGKILVYRIDASKRNRIQVKAQMK